MKQVLQLMQLHSRQAHGNCSSDHTDAPVSTRPPFCKEEKLQTCNILLKIPLKL